MNDFSNRMNDVDDLKEYLALISEIPILDEASEKTLAMLAKKGDIEARNMLVVCNLKLVASIAKNYPIIGDTSRMDLIQEGNLSLIRAAELFDVDKGYRFSTYATYSVKRAIYRSLSNKYRTIGIPAYLLDILVKMNRKIGECKALGFVPSDEDLASYLDVSVSKVIELKKTSESVISLHAEIGEDEDDYLLNMITSDDNVEEEYEKLDLSEEFENIFADFTPREVQVIKLRHGFDGTPRTLEEVAKIMGVTRERIRQIELKVIRRLRRPKYSSRLRVYTER